MTTPDRSVDEIVEELVNKVSHDIPNLIPTRDELDAMKKNILRELRQELTQTLQAERQRCDEMVEAARKEAWIIGYAQCEADNNLMQTCNVDYEALTQPNNK